MVIINHAIFEIRRSYKYICCVETTSDLTTHRRWSKTALADSYATNKYVL